MAIRERPIDRGTLQGRQLLSAIGLEARSARRNRGLDLHDVGSSMGRSKSWVSRLERGLSETITVLEMSQLCAVVGLDLSIRAFPGGDPIRDAAQTTVLERFRGYLHRSIRWSGEVPFPSVGDQRAWDALIRGADWRYGVEAETRPNDVQATARRLLLKARDGGVDGVLLVVPDTRHVRMFLKEFLATVGASFPIDGQRALGLLGAGLNPGGNSVVLLPRQQSVAGPATNSSS
jgi:transcriptional regulator with XRE-family HTH domain